jgi:hypothetical protein
MLGFGDSSFNWDVHWIVITNCCILVIPC